MDHQASARALAQLAVLPQLYRRVAHIDVCIYEWPYRCVGVERFAAAKLLLLLLQIAIGDVEADGVTENMIHCLARTDIFRAGADYDCQLSFKIGLMPGKCYFDHALMSQQRTWRLEPN